MNHYFNLFTLSVFVSLSRKRNKKEVDAAVERYESENTTIDKTIKMLNQVQHDKRKI
ncbi:hypothetical protein JCM19314_1809 [Nonlabens ulvanivorans]|uniref:Uncharacterized protein n=1 Tax=Nonlabens ulvanivorans TaxID=906888 RepID=A0A090QZA1_NONUL|nr:hypothetical protein JCM19314_1809 [Nonlabens ulvanivorans]